MSVHAKNKRGRPTNRSSMYHLLRSNNYGSARPPRFYRQHLGRSYPVYPGSWITHGQVSPSHLQCSDFQSLDGHLKEYLCSGTNDVHTCYTTTQDHKRFVAPRHRRNNITHHGGLPTEGYYQCHPIETLNGFSNDLRGYNGVFNGCNADIHENEDSRYEDDYNDYTNGQAGYQHLCEESGPGGNSDVYMHVPDSFAHCFEGSECNGLCNDRTSDSKCNTSESVNPASIASTFNHDEIVPTLVGVGWMRPHVLVGPFPVTYTMENIWEFVRGIPGVSYVALTVECYGYKSALVVFHNYDQACMALPLINRYHQCLGYSTAAIICSTSSLLDQPPRS